jgi:glycerate kinase
MAFLGAELKPGVALVMDAIDLGSQLEGSSLVITGEGSLDRQTLYGKVPWGVARLAKSQGVPVIALVGNIGPGTEALYDGIDAIMAVPPGPITLDEAMAQASLLIEGATERALRLIRVGEGLKNVPRGVRSSS